MRDPEANLLRNAVTRNPYVWGAIVLCIVILAVAIYLPPLAQVLRIVPPDMRGWGLVLGASLVPLLLGPLLALILPLQSLRRAPREARPARA